MALHPQNPMLCGVDESLVKRRGGGLWSWGSWGVAKVWEVTNIVGCCPWGLAGSVGYLFPGYVLKGLKEGYGGFGIGWWPAEFSVVELGGVGSKKQRSRSGLFYNPGDCGQVSDNKTFFRGVLVGTSQVSRNQQRMPEGAGHLPV